MIMGKRNMLQALLVLAVVTGSVLSADTAEARRRNVRGTIYEDILGDGSLAGDLQAGGVNVRLYEDANNNGLIDAGDVFLQQITTNPSGSFRFRVQTNATGENYLVAVDSRSVSPSAGFNGGYGLNNVWAQQTVGDDPATTALDVGPRFGGVTPGVSDNFNTASTNPANNAYQHVGRAGVSTSNANNLDFGFSFNVVTNTLGGNNTVVQGSLRQFLVNANAAVGANAMRFVPAVAANASGGGGQWWRVSLTSNLPGLVDPGTTVDGTAYDSANGVSILDSNPGTSGTGGPVGTVGVALAAVARPELEIVGSNGTRFGLRIQADLVTVRNLSLHSFSSFSWDAVMGNILVETSAGTIIEQNVLGAGPGSFTDPGAWRSVPVITLNGATGGTLRGNLIGFSDRHGIEGRIGSDIWLIEGNEIFANAQSDGTQNGVSLDGCSNFTVSGNLIHENGGAGVDVLRGSVSTTLAGNTIRRNGIAAIGGTETPGVRIDDSGSLVQGNVLAENYGAGVLVTPAANSVTITQNSILDNGTITNLGGWAATGQVGIDLLGGGDNDRSGTAPFVTLNDNGDGDSGGNGLPGAGDGAQRGRESHLERMGKAGIRDRSVHCGRRPVGPWRRGNLRDDPERGFGPGSGRDGQRLRASAGQRSTGRPGQYQSFPVRDSVAGRRFHGHHTDYHRHGGRVHFGVRRGDHGDGAGPRHPGQQDHRDRVGPGEPAGQSQGHSRCVCPECHLGGQYRSGGGRRGRLDHDGPHPGEHDGFRG